MGATERQAGARPGRLLLVLGAVACLLAGTGMTATDAVMTTTTSTDAAWSAGGLVAPSAVSVEQSCQAAPAPVRRSESFVPGDGSATLALPTPAGVVAGDLLLAGMIWFAGGAVPTPSGWTLVRQEVANPLTQAVFYRVAQAGEPASHTWTHEAESKAGGIIAYRGVDPSSLRTVAGSSGQYLKTPGGVITAPALTTRRPGTVLVGYFGLVGVQTITADSRMTKLHTGSSHGPTRNGQVTLLAAEELHPTVGSTGTRTSTASGGAQTAGQLVALEPPLQPWATTRWTRSPSPSATGQLFRWYAGGSTQETVLSAEATSKVDGPLVPGDPYRADVLATAGSTRSAAATTSFTARSCADA